MFRVLHMIEGQLVLQVNKKIQTCLYLLASYEMSRLCIRQGVTLLDVKPQSWQSSCPRLYEHLLLANLSFKIFFMADA